MTGVKVEEVDEQGVIAGGKRIPSATVLWTAGVAASPIVKVFGAKTDRAGRVTVGPCLELPDAPGIFVIGDTALVMQEGRPVPGVAQAAIQQGRYVGRLICERLKGREPRRPFRYFDKGNMAVVGKNFAILEAGRIRMSGFDLADMGIRPRGLASPAAELTARRNPVALVCTSPVSAAHA